jgi:hypothetical protein
MDTMHKNVQKGEKSSSATIVNSKVTPKNSVGERRKTKKREATWKY